MHLSLHSFIIVDKSKQKQVEVPFERRHYERERQRPVVHESDWWCRMVTYGVSYVTDPPLYTHCTVILSHQFSLSLLPEFWPSFHHYFVVLFLSYCVFLFRNLKQLLLLQLFLTMESPVFYAWILIMYSIWEYITMHLCGRQAFWTGHCPCTLCCRVILWCVVA